MKRPAALVLALSGATVAAGTVLAQGTPPSVTFAPSVASGRPTGAATTPAWFVCDALNAPEVIVVGRPDASGRSVLVTYRKNAADAFSFAAYTVGAADPGAGNVYYPLTPRAGAAPAGSGPLYLRALNPGVLADPARARTPVWTEVKAGAVARSCRWEPDTVLQGFGTRRSVLVTATPRGGFTYRSYDFPLGKPARNASTPSLTITGGRREETATTWRFVFGNAGYTYTVEVARPGGPPGATLTVRRGDRPVLNEVLKGYTLATE